MVFGISGVYAEGFSCDSHLTEVPEGWTGIYNLDELKNMQTNNESVRYILMNDIDASITSTWNSGAGFIPIGYSDVESSSFEGSFDGNCYVISNLYIRGGDSQQEIGLFGVIYQAEIKNVGLENINITGYGDGFGGLVGYSSSSTITNSYATGNVSGISNRGGGLVGYSSSSTITNSYATGNITGKDDIGGLVGYSSSSTITNSYATGNVVGHYETGGLIGMASDSFIFNSYATGNVIGSGESVGGLVGFFPSSTITNSYAIGNVTGSASVGGLVGQSYGSISNSYYNNENYDYSWGIGSDGINQNESADQTGVGGLTTEQMKNHPNFVDWDFNNAWDDTFDGSDYPTLRWQNKANLSNEYMQINLNEGWNLFSISRNYTTNNTDRNITLKKGFNFVGYSGNGSLNFDNVGINGTSWKDAVGSGVISSYVLGFGNNGNGFYAPFMPTSISKNQGYIIYSFYNVNMTIKNTFGNDKIEYRLRNIRAKNDTGIYFFEDVYNDWFYPIGENKTGVYEYNRTEEGSEDYEELELDAKLNSWESYWIRAKYENLSLVIYG